MVVTLRSGDLLECQLIGHVAVLTRGCRQDKNAVVVMLGASAQLLMVG